MSLFPRVFANEFAPVLRLVDEAFTQSLASSRSNGFRHSIRSFQPRFDVKENKDSYELQGEFPGIDQKDIEVSFKDQVLSVRGRSERHHEEGTRPGSEVEAAAEQPKVADNAESETSGYHRASVEEDWETNMSGANPEATPAETPATGNVAAPETKEVAQAPKSEGSKYWVSERAIGQFARTFSFPSRVDEENVKASLKSGILSIVVPKAAAPENHRVEIQ